MEYIIKTKSGEQFWTEDKRNIHQMVEYIRDLKLADEWLRCLNSYNGHNRKTLVNPSEIQTIEQLNKGEFSIAKGKKVDN